MNTLEKIKPAIAKMTREELAMFRIWFEEFDADAWDCQFEEDALAGRLDAMAEEALRDLEEGRCTEI